MWIVRCVVRREWIEGRVDICIQMRYALVHFAWSRLPDPAVFSQRATFTSNLTINPNILAIPFGLPVRQEVWALWVLQVAGEVSFSCILKLSEHSKL